MTTPNDKTEVGSDALFSHSAAYIRGVADAMVGVKPFDCPFTFGSVAFSEWTLGQVAWELHKLRTKRENALGQSPATGGEAATLNQPLK